MGSGLTSQRRGERATSPFPRARAVGWEGQKEVTYARWALSRAAELVTSCSGYRSCCRGLTACRCMPASLVVPVISRRPVSHQNAGLHETALAPTEPHAFNAGQRCPGYGVLLAGTARPAVRTLREGRLQHRFQNLAVNALVVLAQCWSCCGPMCRSLCDGSAASPSSPRR
jgi:hypothetical protein